MTEDVMRKAERGDIDTKDELLRFLVYYSSFTGTLQTGMQGDVDISQALTDDFEDEITELIVNE